MQLVVNGVLTYAERIHPDGNIPVVVLPGWGQDSKHWLSFAKRLPAEFECFLLDQPGFGQTQHLPAGAGVTEYVEWLHTWLEKADVKNPVLFGHSFGGQVAVAYAAKYPTKLRRLILLSPGALRNKSTKVRVIEQLFRHFGWIKKLTPSGLFQKLRPYLASDDYHQASPEQKAVLSKIVLQDQRSRLSKIQVPTDIIWGEKDSEIPYGAKILAEEIPTSRLFVLYGADHSPQLTAPDKLRPVVTDILENL